MTSDGGGCDTEIGKALVEQRGHFAVARGCRGAAHDDADQPVPAAHRRSREIEAGGADIPGLSPAGTFLQIDRVIVPDYHPPTEIKFAVPKIAIHAGKVV